MKKLSERLSYANVVATLALFLALGGVGIAATKLPKNSVGTKQLKKNSVTGAKVKKHTLTGKNINLSKLGTVPSATNAGTASALTPLEPFHAVGAAGEPPFLDGTITRPPEQGVTFHNRPFGRPGQRRPGRKRGRRPDLPAPPGFRPAPGVSITFPSVDSETLLSVLGAGVKSKTGQDISGAVLAIDGAETVASLNGVSFRAEG
jgi:hypothetical protein